MPNYRKSFNFRNGVQVDDDNFIVNPNGLVGIGTTVPTEFLDVRGNARVVGLVTSNSLYASSAIVGVLTVNQDVLVTGIVSATSFTGSASGLTDIYAIAVDGWYIDSGNSYISTTFNVGIGTTTPRGKLQIGTAITFSSNGNATYSGIITASSFSGSGVGLTALPSGQLTGTIDNARLPSNINVSGVVTATSGFVGNVTGIASTARDIVSTANITVNSINSGFSTTGVSTAFTSAYVGTSGTAFAALNSGRIGIGTALPTSELQIRKASASLLEVLSDTDQARVSIGQSVGVGKSTAVLRFGNTAKTFDIINNDTGNINLYLHADVGSPGINTGNFAWFYGQTFSELMTLTYDGKLGINKTNPDNTLHVVGTSTVTGTAWFGNNVNVNNTITAQSLNVTSFNGNVLGNIYSTGISTFNNIQANGNIIVSTSSSIGIGTTLPIVAIDARNKSAIFGGISIGNTTLVNDSSLTVIGGVFSQSAGIGTTTISSSSVFGVYGSVDVYPTLGGSGTYVNLYSAEIITDKKSKIGIGTTAPKSAVDFGEAGKEVGGGAASFMIVPIVTDTVGLNTAGKEGCIVFNTTTKKFQGYTGIAWTDFNL